MTIYMITLTFADKSKASSLMERHKAWLQQGFDAGVFLLSGSLSDGTGGAILATAAEPDALRARVAEDPFVAEKVVTADITAFSPSRADDRLSFLMS